MKLRQTVFGVALAAMASGSNATVIDNKEQCDAYEHIAESVMFYRQIGMSVEEIVSEFAKQIPNEKELLLLAETLGNDAYKVPQETTEAKIEMAIEKYGDQMRMDICTPEVR